MEQNTETQRIRILPVHTQSFMHALGIAMMRAVAWREIDTGKAFSPKDLYDFAKKYDEEHPLDEYYYYMVSREGAIGISPGLEWLTEWMFLPMEECEERDFLIRRMKEELQDELELDNSLEQAVLKGLKAEKAAATQGTVPLFCPYCGISLEPGSKFCGNCGKSVQ